MNALFPTNTGVNGAVKLWPNNANFVLYAGFNANLVDPVKPVSAIIDLFIHSFNNYYLFPGLEYSFGIWDVTAFERSKIQHFPVSQ